MEVCIKMSIKIRKVGFWLGIITLIILAGCASTQDSPADNGGIAAGTSQSDKGISDSAGGPVKEINIEAYNWGFNQEPVTIKKGDRVRIKLTSSSGTHGIAIPDFGVSSGPVSPGQEEIIEFTADKAGTFVYFCNIPCGQGHSSMRGQLVIEE